MTTNFKQIPAHTINESVLSKSLSRNQFTNVQGGYSPVHYCGQIGLLLNQGMAKEESYDGNINCTVSYRKLSVVQ